MGEDGYGYDCTACTRMCMQRRFFDLRSYIGSSAFENFSFDKIWDLCVQLWSWLVSGSCTFERFSFTKAWDLWSQLWPQLWSAWLAWGQPVKQKRLGLTWSTRVLRSCIERNSFRSLHNEFNFENVSLTAPYFFITDGVWQCAGFDSGSQKWRRLPPFTYLPAYCKPDLDLFKEYLLCTKDGIVCMNVSKSTQERLIVFNVLTGKWKELPPLNHRRNPVLMHLLVDATTHHYQVIVAGSSASGDGRLSRMTEVFDSRTWKWKRTGDLPGPDFALNEYQAGVCNDGSLYCIAFLDQEIGRGILQYNLSEGIWLKNSTCPIPFSTTSTILQLVESGGRLYLFSEQEKEHSVEHCVDIVDWNVDGNGGGTWSLKNVVRDKKIGGRSLEVYPENICVPYSEHHVCVFHTIDHSGVVYDVRNHGQSEVLQAPPPRGFGGEGFFSLNPMSFTIEPRFRGKI